MTDSKEEKRQTQGDFLKSFSYSNKMQFERDDPKTEDDNNNNNNNNNNTRTTANNNNNTDVVDNQEEEEEDDEEVIKVDDINEGEINSEKQNERLKYEFHNNNTCIESIRSNINYERRSCSVSSSITSISGSSFSGDDEDDVDSGFDSGHHRENKKKNTTINNHNHQIHRGYYKPLDKKYPEKNPDLGSRNDRKFREFNSCGSLKKEIETPKALLSHGHLLQNNNDKDNCLIMQPNGALCVYYQYRQPTEVPLSSDQIPKTGSPIFIPENPHPRLRSSDTPPDLSRKFTNFLIDDILKPDFGKKPFETGSPTIRTVSPPVNRGAPKAYHSSFSPLFPFSFSSFPQSPPLLSSSSSSFASILTQKTSDVSPFKKKPLSRNSSSSNPNGCLPAKKPHREFLTESFDPSSSLSTHSNSQKQKLLTPSSSSSSLRTSKINGASPRDDSIVETNPSTNNNPQSSLSNEFQFKYPAWVFCTRYSDRPSSGPRSRKMKRKDKKADEKRPRTAFTPEQLQRLKREFDLGRYLTEERRQSLAKELGLNESQIKIWFQNKRAKMKKVSGTKNPLALQLIAEGLYNHQTNKE